jgi:hypothetical protein
MISRVREYFERRRHEREAYQKYLLAVVTRLGLPTDGNHEETILRHALDMVKLILTARGIPEPAHPSELVETVATCLNMEIVEIHNSTDLQNLLSRLAREPTVTRLQIELQYAYAVTMRRQAHAYFEQPFLVRTSDSLRKNGHSICS